MKTIDELQAENDALIGLRNILILCGEPECRDIEDHADKLRALIAGLVTVKNERDALIRERSGMIETHRDNIKRMGKQMEELLAAHDAAIWNEAADLCQAHKDAYLICADIANKACTHEGDCECCEYEQGHITAANMIMKDIKAKGSGE